MKIPTDKYIYVNTAWPYANAHLHLGHVAGLIDADLVARYFRLRGNPVLFVSGSDCHGTPITVTAEKEGLTPAQVASKYHAEFSEILQNKLKFSYDLYTTTTTENHRQVVQELFLDLYKKGFIYKKTDKYPYCTKCQRFLADRYIEGECPKCDSANARGDQCDDCGELLTPDKIKNPRCKLCGETPVWKESEHFFLKLSAFRDELIKWVEKHPEWRGNAQAFTLGTLREGLPDRAITRDISWGIDIPLTGFADKKIYVWFEAVSGYLSASIEWAKNKKDPEAWKLFWEVGDKAVAYYVHGKDNIPFHTIIWPAILLGRGGLHLPDRILSSEYLTLEGKQFSKSRHWAAWLPDFVRDFDPETLRYYLVANGPETADADFSWEQYQTRVNMDLIGKFGNLVNRVFSLIHKNFPEGLDYPKQLSPDAEKIISATKESFDVVGGLYEEGHMQKATREAFALCEKANKYIDAVAPWKTLKTNKDQAGADLTVLGQVIRALLILLNPVLPTASATAAEFIDFKISKWEYPETDFLKIVKPLTPLYKRVEDDQIKEQVAKLG